VTNGLGLAAETPPLAVCGPSTSYGRTAIHKAVCELDLAGLERELSDVANQALLDRRDQAGFCPIHTACALPIFHPDQTPLIFDILRTLLSAGANPSVTDTNENTALHWAARAGCRELAQVLLSKNCPPGKLSTALC
jgi:ankyrin repeat protein